MNYCGIDLSLSGTGFIVINDDSKILVSALVSTKPNLSTEERISFIYRYIYKCLLPYKKSELQINIEGLAYALRGQRSLELAGLHYYFRTNFKRRKIPFVVTPPTTLKKFVTGKGNSKKNLILLGVYKKWGQSFTNDNLADAYSLAKYISTENK